MKFIVKARMNSIKIVSFYFMTFILFEFLFLISSSFSSQKMSASKEDENHFPPLSLVGVMVSKDTSSSIAVLKNEKTGKTKALTIGESIFGLTLVSVFENRIILKKNEKAFQIFLARSNLIRVEEKLQKNKGEISVADRKEELSESNQLDNNLIKKELIKAEIEKRIESEWPLIIQEIKYAPNIIKGKIKGFKITKVPENSILSEVGIYKNDIIKKINDIELNDISILFSLYNKFKDENQFEVSIERDGKLFRLLYILR